MKIQQVLIIALLAALVAGGAFAATRAARSAAASGPTSDAPTEVLFDWLEVPASARAEMQKDDPAFTTDLKQLREALAENRAALAAALEKTESSDELINARVEAVIAAGNALERRVARYLLSVRDHLTAQQQQKLFSLCAEGVRQGPGWCWRQREGGGQGLGRGQGRGGRGGGTGGGFGPGGGGFGPGGGGGGRGFGGPPAP